MRGSKLLNYIEKQLTYSKRSFFIKFEPSYYILTSLFSNTSHNRKSKIKNDSLA